MFLPETLATIDIGTNSVLLTIARQEGDGSIIPLHEEAHITRIGEGLSLNRAFLPEAMERTADQLEKYVALCHELSVDRVVAVGTAAFRLAENRDVFIADIKERLDLLINVIGGEREAELSYRAASRDFGEDILVLDIGGGSTEFIWRHPSQLRALSIPMGSVVLHECLIHSDPISDTDHKTLKLTIESELLTALGSSWGGHANEFLLHGFPEHLVALAGTATTLAAIHKQLETYSHSEVHGTILTKSDIDSMVQRLCAANTAERKEIPGVEEARADVIPVGATILRETMQMFGYEQVTISDRGVRWGLIYEHLSA